MNKEKIYKKIMSIMINQKIIKKGETVDYDANLFETYQINSIIAIKLLIEIENSFGIMLSDDELLPENYRTLNSLINIIINHL